MEHYSESINRLISAFGALPGIGRKTAQRLAFYIISRPKEEIGELAEAIINAGNQVRLCKECCTLTDRDVCSICANPKRDQTTIMVVEDSRDVFAYERTDSFSGVYHVLHGAISPIKGIAPSDIHLKELLQRLSKTDVSEVIIATSSTIEGEATAMYISQLIKPSGIKVSRIASGVPVGGNLENIDEVTLLRALEGRTEL